jgi:hypothetical protein
MVYAIAFISAVLGIVMDYGIAKAIRFDHPIASAAIAAAASTALIVMCLFGNQGMP